jgi:hypothetical protein
MVYVAREYFGDVPVFRPAPSARGAEAAGSRSGMMDEERLWPRDIELDWDPVIDHCIGCKRPALRTCGPLA